MKNFHALLLKLYNFFISQQTDMSEISKTADDKFVERALVAFALSYGDHEF